MSQELIHTSLLAAEFLLLFALTELLYHAFKVDVEITRKIAHAGTGIITLSFPLLLSNHWMVLLLCASFALILVLSLKFNQLKSINAIKRKSVGSIAYPASVYGCFLAYQYSGYEYTYFFLPILVLAICDPVAALMGKRFPLGPYKTGNETKTWMGSSMFFISAFTLVIIEHNLHIDGSGLVFIIVQGLIVATVAALTEAFSRKGYDNLTIPASVLLTLFVTETYF